MSKLPDMQMSTKYSGQGGASALEASLAIVPVLLVCLLGIELVHAHQSKQLVSLALQEAGRTASITNADHHKANQAFAQALAPLFMPAGQYAGGLARLEATMARHERRYAVPLWELKLTKLKDLGAHPSGYRVLQLDLIYLHEPRQSWLRQVLRQSTLWVSAPTKGLAEKARQQGLVAITLSRRAVLHAGEAKYESKRLLEDTKRTPAQELDAQQTFAIGQHALRRRPLLKALRATLPVSQGEDTEAQTPYREAHTHSKLRSRPVAGLNSSQKHSPPNKHSNVGAVVPALDKDDLCGVLLCCAH